MSRTKPFLTAGTLAAVVLAASAIAAWSTRFLIFGGDGHKKLSELALAPALIPPDDYKDLDRFRALLIDGSMSESGHPSFFGNHARNNSLVADWREISQQEYPGLDFARAYRHIGIMGHLVQDHASPAHAFDIAHVSYQPGWIWPQVTKAFFFGDNMETYADDVFAPIIGAEEPNITEPQQAYDVIIGRTKDAVNLNEGAPGPWAGSAAVKAQAKDANGNDTNGWPFYWGGKVSGDLLFDRQFIPFFGSANLPFAGKYGPNEFPRFLVGPGRGNRPDPATPGPKIVREYPPGWRDEYDTFMNKRLGDAIAYSAACWKAASRKLPPFALRPAPTVPPAPPAALVTHECHEGGTATVHVHVVLMENRKPNVRVTVLLDGAPKLEDVPVTLLPNATLTELPWKLVYDAPSFEAAGGPHTLTVIVKDEDNNESDPLVEPVVFCGMISQ